MFKDVLSHIEKGELKKALRALRSINKLQELNPRDLLRYFQLSRRMGDFHYGALQLEKIGALFPELEIEMAFFLGELGAVQQSIRLLKLNTAVLSDEVEVQRHLQLGNFLSLTHDYGSALAAYEKMEFFANKNQPVLALVARLNVLGHKVYSGLELSESIEALKEFSQEKLSTYPLLRQGTCYFLALAHMKMAQKKPAKKHLNEAFSVGVKHRMRESLLLELTRIELDPALPSKSDLSLLKKKILSQVHIIYLDQFHKIMGLRCAQENNKAAALRYFERVIFGERQHGHYFESLQHRKELDGEKEHTYGWEIQRQLAQPLSRRQIIYNELEKNAWPLFKNEHRLVSLEKEPKLIREMSLYLIRQLGFYVRDAEAWEHIWKTPYSFISSPTVIRSLMHRWRKSELAEFAQLTQNQLRLKLTLKDRTRFYTP